MNQEHIFRIITAYGLTPIAAFAPQKGYRNQSFPVRTKDDGGIVNFILYKDEPNILSKIKNANRMSDFVAAHSLPARKTVSPKIMKLQGDGSPRFGSLYEYLPGHTIPWESYTKEHIKILGATLSAMHTILKPAPRQDELPCVASEYLAIMQRVQRYFTTHEVAEALETKLAVSVDASCIMRMQQLLTVCISLDEQQPLHMDFVRSNVLFLEKEGRLVVSGILDFEKTARGHRAFDITRTLAFLLVDCKHKPADKIRKYFLLSGYNKRGTSHISDVTLKTTNGEIHVLDALVDMFLLHDFYKFLRHNPYEYLSKNEHYIRTRDLLATRQIICFNDGQGKC